MLFIVAKKKSNPTAFGRALRAKRESAGLTQSELGERTAIAQTLIARLENSPKANPTLETIRKLAAALGCDPCDLISDG